MKLNIITENKDWIISRCASEIQKAIPGTTINGEQGISDIDYFLTYDKFQDSHKNTNTIRAAFYTHFEPDNIIKKTRFIECMQKCNIHVTMSEATWHNIVSYDQFKKNPIIIIKPGTDLKKTITFGICGRPYGSGRKGQKVVKDLVDSGYNLLAWGSKDWPCKVLDIPYSNIKEFYSQIDYLIIPSFLEGGPMPVLEAMALGVPVIAPNVGWCWDYPVIKYEHSENNLNLKIKLDKIVKPRTWSDWGMQHKKFFEKVLNEKNQQLVSAGQ